jgi:hypothetical protein
MLRRLATIEEKMRVVINFVPYLVEVVDPEVF